MEGMAGKGGEKYFNHGVRGGRKALLDKPAVARGGISVSLQAT
jgi:hypothetical protein